MHFKKNYLLLFIIILFTKTCGKSFLYPVYYDKDNNLVYLINQKSIDNLELWSFNSDTKFKKKILMPHFLPGGLKILPSKKGFSFIDQGRLRIKYFDIETPKTIDFYEPICDISVIEWMNDQFCYFAARKINNFVILEADIKNCKIKTIVENENDCMYPQKVSSFIFFIERKVNKDYRTTKYNYKIIRKHYLTKNDHKEIILDKGSCSIAFLYMISSKEGFFVEHPNFQDELITFTYHHFFENNQNWQDEELFSFTLPRIYILGTNKERLYESILPFLPKHIDGKIFFCSCQVSNIDQNFINNFPVNIYSYEFINSTITKVTNASKNQICFSPVFALSKMFYGSIYVTNDLMQDNIDTSMLSSVYF